MPAHRIALYAGSFDPPHLGHFDVLERACALADEVVVALGVHPGKAPTLDTATREQLIREHAAARELPVRVVTFDGLVTACAREQGARLIVRGVRNAVDLAYEMEMAAMNGAMAGDVETVLLPARPHLSALSGTQIRQIAKMGGPLGAFVTPPVEAALRTAAAV